MEAFTFYPPGGIGRKLMVRADRTRRGTGRRSYRHDGASADAGADGGKLPLRRKLGRTIPTGMVMEETIFGVLRFARNIEVSPKTVRCRDEQNGLTWISVQNGRYIVC